MNVDIEIHPQLNIYSHKELQNKWLLIRIFVTDFKHFYINYKLIYMLCYK